MAPATPGTIICFIAAVCLALASFSTPLIKPLYFLKATLNSDSFTGELTLGTLGYCATVSGTQTCSSPSVGYELDLGAIFNVTIVDIPEVVAKWITYVLVLHIVALGIAALAFVLGLIAHCQQFAMTCLSSCTAGVGCSVACIAFIFDIVLFLLARTRIRSIGGTSSLGPAVWLTLAGWLCLLFSGCFFGCGRRCISARGPRDPDGGARGKRLPFDDRYAEEARIEAIRSEEERKARQAAEGTGFGGTTSHLPGFQPYSAESQPLTSRGADQWLDEDADPSLAHSGAYRDQPDPSVVGGYPRSAASHTDSYAAGGYNAGVGSGGQGLDAYGRPMGGLQRRPSDTYYASGQQSPGGYPALQDNSNYYQADPYNNPYDPAQTQTSGYAPQGGSWEGANYGQSGPTQSDYHNVVPASVGYAAAGAVPYGHSAQSPVSASDPRRAMQAGFVSPPQQPQHDAAYGGYSTPTPDPYGQHQQQAPQPIHSPDPNANVYQPAPVRLQHVSEASNYYDAQDHQQQQAATAAGPSAGGPPSYELTAMEGGASSSILRDASGYAQEKMGYSRS